MRLLIFCRSVDAPPRDRLFVVLADPTNRGSHQYSACIVKSLLRPQGVAGGRTGVAGNLEGVRVAHIGDAGNLEGVAWHGHSPAA